MKEFDLVRRCQNSRQIANASEVLHLASPVKGCHPQDYHAKVVQLIERVAAFALTQCSKEYTVLVPFLVEVAELLESIDEPTACGMRDELDRASEGHPTSRTRLQSVLSDIEELVKVLAGYGLS